MSSASRLKRSFICQSVTAHPDHQAQNLSTHVLYSCTALRGHHAGCLGIVWRWIIKKTEVGVRLNNWPCQQQTRTAQAAGPGQPSEPKLLFCCVAFLGPKGSRDCCPLFCHCECKLFQYQLEGSCSRRACAALQQCLAAGCISQKVALQLEPRVRGAARAHLYNSTQTSRPDFA
jgi:hypothetical protein